MRQLTLSFDHDLTQPAARSRVKNLLQERQQAGGHWTHHWSSPDRLLFVVKLTGGTVTGEVRIRKDKIKVTAKLPGALQLFANRIQRSLEQSARQALTRH